MTSRRSHTLFLTVDGSVWTFGLNENGELCQGDFILRKVAVKITGVPQADYIAVGETSTFIKARNGTVYACGDNTSGQLGILQTTGVVDKVNELHPVVLSDMLIREARNDTIQKISGGYDHTLFLTLLGRVFVCGSNQWSQLGLQRPGPFLAIPTELKYDEINGTLFDTLKISAGYHHSLILQKDGSLWSFGLNIKFQCGIGRADATVIIPTRVPGISNVVRMFASIDHSIAHTAAGQVYFFGTNTVNQWCMPGVVSSIIPIVNSLLSEFVGIYSSSTHLFGINKDGKAFSCGSNTKGELGLGDFDPRPTPFVNPYLYYALVLEMYVGDGYTMWLRYNPTSSQLEFVGCGSSLSLPIQTDFPRAVPNIPGYDAAGLESGKLSSGVRLSTRDFLSFGTISDITTNSPTKLPWRPEISSSDRFIVRVALGDDHILVLNSLGKLYGYGTNSVNQLGPNGDFSSLNLLNVSQGDWVQIAVGGQHSLMLNSLNELYGIGNNQGCQLADSSRGKKSIPFRIPFNFTDIATISAGPDCSFVLTSGGGLFAWGRNDLSQLCNPIEGEQYLYIPFFIMENVLSVSNGGLSTMFVTKNHSLFGCGWNGNGEMGIGPPRPGQNHRNATYLMQENVAVVSVGETHALLLFTNGSVYASGRGDKGQLGLGSVKRIDTGFNTAGVHYWTKIEVQNVTHIAARSEHSVIMNSCSGTYSGSNCSLLLCFGVPISMSHVCSGSGKCIGFDKCVCDSPSSGPNCEYKTFYFNGPDGQNTKWEQSVNWAFVRGSRREIAWNSPGLKGDRVLFDTSASSVTMTSQTMNLASLSLGFSNHTVNLILNNCMLKVNEMTMTQWSSITLIDSILHITNGLSRTTGAITMRRSKLFVGDIQLTVPPKINPTAYIFDNSEIHAEEIVIRARTLFVSSRIFAKKMHLSGINISGGAHEGRIRAQGLTTFDVDHIINDGAISVENGAGSTISTVSVRNVTNSRAGTISIASILGPIHANNVIINRGSIQMLGGDIRIHIRNFLSFRALGYGRINRIKSIESSELVPRTGRFWMVDTTLIVDSDVNITCGTFSGSGIIKTGHFTFSSSTGEFYLTDFLPNRLTIDGDATFSHGTTTVIEAETSRLNVTGKYRVNGLTLVKYNSTARDLQIEPKLDFLVPWVSYGSYEASNEQLSLFGVPYTNMKYVFGPRECSLQVVSSFGSAGMEGYKCQYIGNRRHLEINVLKDQDRILMSFTTPIRSGSYAGFGFDYNGTIQHSTMFMGMAYPGRNNHRITEVGNHNQSYTWSAILRDSGVSASFFGIGQKFHTISVVLPLSTVQNQQFLYFAEIKALNSTSELFFFNTGPHYHEAYEHNIIEEDENECTNFNQPLRLEIYHEAFFYTMISVYIVLFILCVLLHRFRPLNTRGISPILTLLFLLSHLSIEAKNLYEIGDYQGSLCVYYSFMYPFNLGCFVLILLYFVRFFSVINFNEFKADLYRSEKTGHSEGHSAEFQKKKIRIFKWLATSPILTLFIIFVTFTVSIMINVIIMATNNMKCGFDTLIIMKIVGNVQLIGVYFAILMCLILDYSVRICRINFFKYLFGDIYLFRLQIFLFVPFVLYSMSVEIFQIITSFEYIAIIRNHYTSVLLNTIGFLWLLLIDVILPVAVTIIQLLCLLRKKRKRKEIEEILSNEVTKEMFINFCEAEFSIENILIYFDIMEFKANPTVVKAVMIYDKYCRGSDSVMEVNIRKKNADEVRDLIDAGKIELNLFDAILGEVNMNLADTLARFQFSSEFEAYTDHGRRQQEMLEGRYELKVPLLAEETPQSRSSTKLSINDSFVHL